jgi:DNA repair protein RadC
MTRRVVEAAGALGIAVHDHVIVAGDALTSLRTLGLM